MDLYLTSHTGYSNCSLPLLLQYTVWLAACFLGLTCVCGPMIRQGLTSFSMECHVELEHQLLALYLILPHWYNLEEVQLDECGGCPWLLARIARQTAAPY